jgi:hypothetical protein
MMPQLGPHIYPDTAEGIEAYEGMKARMGGNPTPKPKAPPAASVEPAKAKPKRKNAVKD